MVESESEHHQRLIFGVTTAVFILAITSYVLRLYARHISEARFWYDDYVMAGALVRHFFFLAFPLRAFSMKCVDISTVFSFVRLFPVFVIMLVRMKHTYRSILQFFWPKITKSLGLRHGYGKHVADLSIADQRAYSIVCIISDVFCISMWFLLNICCRICMF